MLDIYDEFRRLVEVFELKRVSQLRRLGLLLQKARIKEDPKTNKSDREGALTPSDASKPKEK